MRAYLSERERAPASFTFRVEDGVSDFLVCRCRGNVTSVYHYGNSGSDRVRSNLFFASFLVTTDSS